MVTLWYSGKLSSKEEQVELGDTNGVAPSERVHSGLATHCRDMDWERIILKLFFLEEIEQK